MRLICMLGHLRGYRCTFMSASRGSHFTSIIWLTIDLLKLNPAGGGPFSLNGNPKNPQERETKSSEDIQLLKSCAPMRTKSCQRAVVQQAMRKIF